MLADRSVLAATPLGAAVGAAQSESAPDWLVLAQVARILGLLAAVSVGSGWCWC